MYQKPQLPEQLHQLPRIENSMPFSVSVGQDMPGSGAGLLYFGAGMSNVSRSYSVEILRLLGSHLTPYPMVLRYFDSSDICKDEAVSHILRK